jgi:hypothetical protein
MDDVLFSRGVFRDPSGQGVFRKRRNLIPQQSFIASTSITLNGGLTGTPSVQKQVNKLEVLGVSLTSAEVLVTKHLNSIAANLVISPIEVLDYLPYFRQWTEPLPKIGIFRTSAGQGAFRQRKEPTWMHVQATLTSTTLNASVALTGVITRLSLYQRLEALGITLTPTQVKVDKFYRSMAGSLVLTPVESLVSSHLRAVVAAMTLTPAETTVAIHPRTLAQSIALAATMTRIAKHFSIFSLTMTDTLTMSELLGQLIAMPVATSFTLASQRQTLKTMADVLSLSVAQARPMTAYRAFSGSAGLTAALTNAQVFKRTLATTTLFNLVQSRALNARLALVLVLLEGMQRDGHASVQFDSVMNIAVVQKRKIFYKMQAGALLSAVLSNTGYAQQTLAADVHWFVSLGATGSHSRAFQYNLNVNPFLLDSPTVFSRRFFTYARLTGARLEKPKLVRAKAR